MKLNVILDDQGNIIIMSRADGEGIIGDYYKEIKKGNSFVVEGSEYNYEDLVKASEKGFLELK